MSNFPLPSAEPETSVSPLPVREVGRSGRLDLCFNARRGCTVLGRQYHEVPFKVTRVHYSRASSLARVILMHSTAGLFGGDRLEARIHVETGAQALVTSQSATKIHPSGIAAACQSLRIEVETGGGVALLRRSSYSVCEQPPRSGRDIRIELGSGAPFLLLGRPDGRPCPQRGKLALQTNCAQRPPC